MKILGKKISRLKFDYWLSVGETEGTYRKMVLLLLEIKSTTAQDLHLTRHVTTKRCPYCKNGLKSLGKRDPDAQESDWYEICTDCGFWRHHEADKMFNDRFQFSAIKRFRDSDTSPSISHLCSEIRLAKSIFMIWSQVVSSDLLAQFFPISIIVRFIMWGAAVMRAMRGS